MIRKIHLWIGIIGLVAFILSGQYFSLVLDGLQGLDDTPRLLLRTSHIYLFLASTINLVLGLYCVEPKKPNGLIIYNQSLIMLSPFFIGYGFVFETLTNPGIDRTIGNMGIFLILAWLANIAIGTIYSRIRFGKTLKSRTSVEEEPRSAS